MTLNKQTLTIPASAADEAPGAGLYSLVSSCRSVCGLRQVNQDVATVIRFRVQETDEISVGVVADGMGGIQSGDVAAAQSVQAFVACFLSTVLMGIQHGVAWGFACGMQCAFEFANRWVIRYAKSQPAHQGMGTTLTVVTVEGKMMYVGSVGDSRVYRLRRGSIEQLTRDDSFVQLLVDQRLITREEADEHPRANELTRALGSPSDTQDLNITCHEVKAGDLVLICSDGFWKFFIPLLENACKALSDEIVTPERLDQFSADLVELALAAGSDDNISVVTFYWNCLDEPSTDTTSTNEEEV
jgi:serine/threonine protein phosphatase PrpC